MTKSLSLVTLLFVVFGCATLWDSPETPTATNPGIQIKGAQSENVPLNTGAKLEDAGDSDRKQISASTFSAEEVRRVQALLKTVGFDPGRIDGAFGPKTKNALLRLRSSCSALKDLLQGVDLEMIAPAIEFPGAHRKDLARRMLSKEEIRIIQVRLKDAGFDIGAVDGISGPNTRGGVARFRSGCGAVKTMPTAVLEAAASTEQGRIGGTARARDDKVSVAIPDEGVGTAKLGGLTSAGAKNSGAGGMRPLH
jgi:peptidoglycan hydrolase-like protein with peptidoglycan-binding domain